MYFKQFSVRKCFSGSPKKIGAKKCNFKKIALANVFNVQKLFIFMTQWAMGKL